jgi:hypothetical protein
VIWFVVIQNHHIGLWYSLNHHLVEDFQLILGNGLWFSLNDAGASSEKAHVEGQLSAIAHLFNYWESEKWHFLKIHFERMIE